ncbi:hypothetical protein OKW21_000217 [Catalinimonas alkaloidigena]|uniref:hypothetical protein n=1 Tax=Catalinimonas alkaloidigena TaxID=1075417 RepID=UPI002406D55B|nr:hypothetical protein [Catalinimonas alkaloidigena]MDF9794954.1 hypothetical protein [Catalinimonas alkaloidigena]
MRRSIIALAALAIFSFTTVGANAIPVQQDAVVAFMQDTRTEMEYDNLPQAVKTAFEESDHKDMDVTMVYEVTTEDGTHYELNITDGTNSSILKYDAEGNEIEE